MLMFYDFEVFKEDWIVVVINPIEQTEDVIVNDREKLIELYEMSKNKIWIGYNSRNYDQFILKGIILGLNPKSISDYIINERVNGNLIDRRFKNIKLYNYDCMVSMNGLKTLEGFMGNNIHETSVDFNIDRKLTVDEITQTIEYCRNDVEQTIKIFMKTKDDFNAQMDLIKTFNLPMDNIGLTKAQLTANILQCKKPIDERYDEFDLQFVDTLKIEKYKEVVDWFKNSSNRNYMKNLKIDIAGIPHIFGWGGLHGCHNKPIHRKVYHITGLASGNNYFGDTTGIEEYINGYGIVHRSNENHYFISSYQTTNAFVAIGMDNNAYHKFNLVIGSGVSDITDAYVVIEYTKSS
jgi:hypothetical protein